jgi:hypothetical protein
MQQCAAKIQDTQLCQIPMPGSHDAGSYAVNTKSLTQQYSIREQLDIGVRYFDLRVRVDNGLFFSHHGADESPIVAYTTADAAKLPPNTIFSQIVGFCQQNPGEIVILCFQDFTSVQGQSFRPTDATDFIAAMRRDLGGLLHPWSGDSSRIPIPTYGDCIARGQRVLAIFNDGGWNPLQDSWVWPWSQYLGDRFSDYKYLLHSWDTLISDTISDQEDYLKAGGTDHRQLDWFWVSQAVLGYSNTDTPDGHSQNYAGASYLNQPFITAYKGWWSSSAVQKPNILLMDYSGVYDNFAADCVALL